MGENKGCKDCCYYINNNDVKKKGMCDKKHTDHYILMADIWCDDFKGGIKKRKVTNNSFSGGGFGGLSSPIEKAAKSFFGDEEKRKGKLKNVSNRE